MKKKILAIIVAAIISAPALFAFHEEDTDHLVAGMPVVFMVTGLKITPQQHLEARASTQALYASECFLSQRISMDVLVDEMGNGTMIMRWPTKESYMADRKSVVDANHPEGICEAHAKARSTLVKLIMANGVNPRKDLKVSIMTSIAPSPR